MRERSWFRVVATFAAFLLVANMTASGIVAGVEAFGEAYTQWARRNPGMYTERPRAVYRGPNPGRDPVYRAGRWNPRTLRALRNINQGRLVAGYEAMQMGGGGDPGGGDPGGGEGGGGGPGGGGDPGISGPGGNEPGVNFSNAGGSGSGVTAGIVNTNNGNKLTWLNIVGWP